MDLRNNRVIFIHRLIEGAKGERERKGGVVRVISYIRFKGSGERQSINL
jgi:hypothetical protein